MEISQVPPLAWIAFAGSFICTASVFGSCFLITRRLGMAWQGNRSNFSLGNDDANRLGKLILGREASPPEAKVEGLIWAVRAFWIADVACILAFAALLAGVN